MPPAINKRGRPKGHEVTVIGLPAKKRKKNTSEPYKPRLQPFIRLHTSIKDKGRLKGWFRSPAHVMLHFSYSYVKVVC